MKGIEIIDLIDEAIHIGQEYASDEQILDYIEKLLQKREGNK